MTDDASYSKNEATAAEPSASAMAEGPAEPMSAEERAVLIDLFDSIFGKPSGGYRSAAGVRARADGGFSAYAMHAAPKGSRPGIERSVSSRDPRRAVLGLHAKLERLTAERNEGTARSLQASKAAVAKGAFR